MPPRAPRQRREPGPIEPDVADALAASSPAVREARASVALDRDQTHVVDDYKPCDECETTGRNCLAHPGEVTEPEPMTPDEAADIIERWQATDVDAATPPRVAEAYRVHREHYAADVTEGAPTAAPAGVILAEDDAEDDEAHAVDLMDGCADYSHPDALAEAQAGLTGAERSRAARMLDRDPALDESLQILERIDRLAAAPTDRAVLTMPLGRLIDADGTETVIGEAQIVVAIDRAGLLEFLAGDDAAEPCAWTVNSVLTADGVDAIRQLAALLPEGGAA